MLQHLLLVALLGAASAQIPRGVDPKNAAKYSGKQFTCLDGSKSIPSERVNDNYCDCPGDGSDEPGTAACYHGTFWCRNRGFEPSVISSSFVDDGVCDCCDGSDESAVGCSNTCLEKSAHERQAIRDKVAAYERSLEKKKQAEEHAKSLQSQWQQRSSSIQKELDEQQAEVKRIEEEKAKADAALEEERKAAEAEEARVAAEQAAAAAAAQAAGGDAAAEGSAAEGEQQQEQAAEVPHEETPEERGRRIASQWTHDPDAAGVPASHADEVAGEEHHEAGEFVPDDHEHIEHEADYQPLEHAPEDDHASYHHDSAPHEAQPTAEQGAGVAGAAQQQQQNGAGGGGGLWGLISRHPAVTSWQPVIKHVRERYKEELEDFGRFAGVVGEVGRQIKEIFSDMAAGGIQERQRRQAERARVKGAEKEAEQQKILQDLMEKLNVFQKEQAEIAQQRQQQERQQQEQQQQQQQQSQEQVGQAQAEQQPAPEAHESPSPSSPPPPLPPPSPPPPHPPPPPPAPPSLFKNRAQRREQRAKELAASAYTPPPPSAAQLAATDASNQLISARTRLEELKKEANLIDRYHVKRDQYDFGPGNVFLGLAGRCLIDRGQRWHYEACFFEKATQSEPYSSTNRVTLGYWKGFNADYTQALFTDGDICHGVGPRTFTIDFVCGEEEKVWGGEEPATCQYRATMSTPAACKLEDLAKEKAQLATLEAFEAEIRAEIEAAAKARAHTEL